MPDTELFYIETLGKLYLDVQQQKVFPDSKYFVDSKLNTTAATVLQAYEKERMHPGFDLKDFVSRYFVLPPAFVSAYQSANKPIISHLEAVWDELTRQPVAGAGGTLIPLPFPYVVPGGRFREIYYWDSYFTLLGLQVCKRVATMQHMVDNFSHLIDRFGFIPNGNRTYYLSRSQPPFFTLMIELLAEEKGDDMLLKYLPQVEKEYAFWMDGEAQLITANSAYRHLVRLSGGLLANRYWDDNDTPRPEAYTEDSKAAGPAGAGAALTHRHIRAACESGWDFSSRWCKDGKNMATIQAAHLVPVDLNCLLLHTEAFLLNMYTRSNQSESAALFTKKISDRKQVIQEYCYNKDIGFYFDYHFIDQAITGQFTLAAVYPLFFKIATAEQASAVAGIIAEKFLQQGGLTTTLSATGQQWDLPNGWAPLQWMAYKGLKHYGHDALAGQVKQRWMAANEKVYAATGKMMEKYDTTDAATKAGGGEYPNQDGFGWTNGVYLKFSREP